jgi:hypothetical protein
MLLCRSSSSSDEPERGAALPRNASADVRLQLEQAVLIPQRLRQGTRLQRVTCMLYIPPECSSGSCAVLGQVHRQLPCTGKGEAHTPCDEKPREKGRGRKEGRKRGAEGGRERGVRDAEKNEKRGRKVHSLQLTMCEVAQ